MPDRIQTSGPKRSTENSTLTPALNSIHALSFLMNHLIVVRVGWTWVLECYQGIWDRGWGWIWIWNWKWNWRVGIEGGGVFTGCQNSREIREAKMFRLKWSRNDPNSRDLMRDIFWIAMFSWSARSFDGWSWLAGRSLKWRSVNWLYIVVLLY